MKIWAQNERHFKVELAKVTEEVMWDLPEEGTRLNDSSCPLLLASKHLEAFKKLRAEVVKDFYLYLIETGILSLSA